MEASIVDLRYKTAQILAALEKREKVTILYHGKIKGVIMPIPSPKDKKLSEHSFFGMNAADKKSVKTVVKELRRGRYRDL